VQQLRILDTSFEPPPHFDALAYLLNSIATFPGTWQIAVLLKTTLEDARRRVPPATALLEEADGGVLLRSWADELEWFAHFLVGLRCPLVVLHPPELRDELHKVAQRITEMAEAV
jgi:predicted DNA-binding transcriptional regulator YafY